MPAPTIPPSFSITAPFTVTNLLYNQWFDFGLENVQTQIRDALVGPVRACIILWIAIQGILVMRGDLDTRRSLTKIIMISIIYVLVTDTASYDGNIRAFFEEAVPNFVQETLVDIPSAALPSLLDGIFVAGEFLFQSVASEISPENDKEAMALSGAQIAFYGSLWTTFAIIFTTSILMDVLLAIGPLALLMYMFDSTQEIAKRWLGQLIHYSLLLLLVKIVASLVIAAQGMGILSLRTMMATLSTTPAKVIALYQLDILLWSGNALVVALPTIAGHIGGSLASGVPDTARSIQARIVRTAGR